MYHAASFCPVLSLPLKFLSRGGGGGAGAHSSESTLNQRGMWI